MQPRDDDSPSISHTRRSAALFAVAIFVSAFLLFQIQPLVSKAILPWFGGSPGVWTTCMLFFQLALFGGYVYAHLSSTRLPVRGQVGLHLLLLIIAISMLRVIPEAPSPGDAAGAPTLSIVLLLSKSVGLPYFLLATTGPLLQRWYSLVYPDRSPYRLYALSNAGSLLALLSYPFVVEPLLRISRQAGLWAAGFGLFAGLCSGCGILLWNSHAAALHPVELGSGEPVDSGRPTVRRYAVWFVLALLASTMYLAITNQVCQDVAVVPFLWVVPLSLYLLSFILCFESDRWYRRRGWSLGTCALVIGVALLQVEGPKVPLLAQVGVHFGALFCVCMTCHGELARSRPAPRDLTAFYLTLSAGGAGGGLFVALLAPRIFPDFWELHLSLLAAGVCATLVLLDDRPPTQHEGRPPLLPLVTGVALVVLVGTVFIESITNYSSSIAMERNFYGVLEVEDDPADDATILRHGQIIHGLQLRTAGLQMAPTTYYVRRSGIGRMLELLMSRHQSLRVGLVGLGVGTLAAYGRPGDVYRFYEINEAVDRLAQEHFTFLSSTPADVETILGDARLSLAGESPQRYDLLVLDAFAGDAIPTHLLTREAFAEYLRHVEPDGVIAVHISNLYFDLQPVLLALADEFGLQAVTILVSENSSPVDPSSEWVLLSRDTALLKSESLRLDAIPPPDKRVLWTDSYSNLFGVLRSKSLE